MNRKYLLKLSEDLKNVDVDRILGQSKKYLFDGHTNEDKNNAIINATRDFIEVHYDYSYLSSRILLGSVQSGIKNTFREYIDRGVEIGILNNNLLRYDFEYISDKIDHTRDNLFQYLGARTIYDRYLIRDRNNEILEKPQWMWMRIAMGLAINEKNKNERAVEFYNIMSELKIIPSTPTLFNSGTSHSQMSSCYVLTMEDSLSGIMKTMADTAQLSKFAGGIGCDWTNIRGINSSINSSNGKSQGTVPFLKVYNDLAIACNQQGKRRGAFAAYMEPWHIDFEDFIELRKNTGDERRRTHDLHTAAWIPDLFMNRVEQNGQWMLVSPNDCPDLHRLYGEDFEEKYLQYEKCPPKLHKIVKARDLWRKMLTMLYETGHPFLCWKDAANIRNQQKHVGTINSSNLCTEILLPTNRHETAVCNLNSINIGKFVKDGKIDKEGVRSAIRTAIRMLDNVIDLNYYPTEEARYSNMKHRPVGLGIMGYHDALFQIGIRFNSQEQIEFADEITELYSHCAIEASADLARERGSYESFIGSNWSNGILPIDTFVDQDEKRGMRLDESIQNTPIKLNWNEIRDKVKKGMRNSFVMAIAPTSSIANIAGCSPCVEPMFKNIYMKENLSGSFLVVNKFLYDDLQEENLLNKNIIDKIKIADGSINNIEEIPLYIREKYKETFEIGPRYIIESAARRQKWIDQGMSTNLFLKTLSGRVLSEIYIRAWRLGLKTTYYLRTIGASQVTKTTGEDATACSILNGDECEACQ